MTTHTPRIVIFFCVRACALALSVSSVAAQSFIAGEDEAFYEAYNDGWRTGDWSGRGFGQWRLFAPEYAAAEEEQYVGFFIAYADKETDLAQTAREGKAFGIFANGTGFEETVAFRAFEQPLNVGDVFSLRFEFDGFNNKFERDSEKTSSVGVAMHLQTEINDSSELSEGRALVLAVIEGLSTYQILDADARFNTRVFLDSEGVEVGVTIGAAGRYDLQLTTLSDHVMHHFIGRTLKQAESKKGGAVKLDPQLNGFALFNLNGGKKNAYFGAFQISRQEGEF
ncbi:MAG: hypothetical protein P8R37_06750 [Opitutae bacterium]|nr:hypothetical protein [Opitutae bacterium]MDG1301269.1 hypothetical protein [Opitutae bacterium]